MGTTTNYRLTPLVRDMIDFELRALGGQVGLDETYPEGDPVLEGLWAVAVIGVDAQEGSIDVRVAARWVAAAILTVNFGPAFVAEAIA